MLFGSVDCLSLIKRFSKACQQWDRRRSLSDWWRSFLWPTDLLYRWQRLHLCAVDNSSMVHARQKKGLWKERHEPMKVVLTLDGFHSWHASWCCWHANEWSSVVRSYGLHLLLDLGFLSCGSKKKNEGPHERYGDTSESINGFLSYLEWKTIVDSKALVSRLKRVHHQIPSFISSYFPFGICWWDPMHETLFFDQCFLSVNLADRERDSERKSIWCKEWLCLLKLMSSSSVECITDFSFANSFPFIIGEIWSAFQSWVLCLLLDQSTGEIDGKRLIRELPHMTEIIHGFLDRGICPPFQWSPLWWTISPRNLIQGMNL